MVQMNNNQTDRFYQAEPSSLGIAAVNVTLFLIKNIILVGESFSEEKSDVKFNEQTEEDYRLGI